ncbi:MAG: acetylglutamate kinase [Syntrophomonadaceae bacterium]|nr:acetylglutamate kinase [Syntrophomonadaceae bacterium]
MMSAIEKAGVLVEALPYIRRFYGRTVVVKFGGHAMIDQALKEAVAKDLILMKFVGINPVLVHGGGPEISALLSRLGKPSSFIQGLRVTDRETLEVVEMVVGKINQEIVSLINRHGGKAVGLSGKDGGLIEARKKLLDQSEGVDLGYVGEVSRVNPEIIHTVSASGYIPVVCPIGAGPEGEGYNINADIVAGELAGALGADKLILLTDVEGIYRVQDDVNSLISLVKLEEIPELIGQRVISGGMLPKVECCVRAITSGTGSAHIIDGRIPHSILLEIFTDRGIGTMVIP